MNRPDVRNAFNAELIAALRDAFRALSADDGVRTIVLAGEGKTFSGGADIGWMRAALDLTEAENIRDAEAMAAMLIAIDRCPKPVIARVQGAALGGGCGLAAVADIVVAANDAGSLLLLGEDELFVFEAGMKEQIHRQGVDLV